MDIRFSRSAARALVRCDKARLILDKIGELAAHPEGLATNIKRLTGRPEYRLRVQNWGVLFRFEDDVLWIDEIAPRGSAYEDRS